jgi:hypothetical protein
MGIDYELENLEDIEEKERVIKESIEEEESKEPGKFESVADVLKRKYEKTSHKTT